VDKGLQELFLQLVRLGIGTETDSSHKFQFSSSKNWAQLKALADAQGLSAVVLDGIEQLPIKNRPPKEILLNWIGSVIQEEQRYANQWKVACGLDYLFAKSGIQTYVLKGTVVSECYPIPNHRCSVDLDCFLKSSKVDDVWELGNRMVENAGFKVERDFYKNSTLILPGLIVENHKYLTPFRGNKKLKSLEFFLQDLLRMDKGTDCFDGTELIRPPVMVSALFLIEHTYSHFLHEGLNWRHVLDWMMFSKKHQKEIDWPQFEKWIDEFGFREFYTSYYNLGKYLLGEIEEEDLTAKDKLVLADVWAPLDLHETIDGMKGKLNLASNTWRARWKYREFTDMTWIKALWIQVKGFVFIKEPKL